MAATEEIIKAVDELGDSFKEKFNQTQKRVEELEQMVQEQKAKGATSFGSGSKDISLQADVSRAIQDNAEGLKAFQSGEVNRLTIEVKAMSTGNLTGGTAALNSNPYGIVGSINRFFHVRDVMPKVPMTGGTLPVIRDNGYVGGFSTVAEGATKPNLDFNLAEVPAKAEVIAAITNVTRQFIDDLGPQGVQAWLQNRLTELYLIAEDDQLLNGNGTSPNLNGLNTTGNFTAASAAATDNDVVQLVKALVQMRSLGRTPRVIIIHPDSLSTILLNTATGSGEFDLPGYVTANAQGGISILGVPVIDTVAQPTGTFNVLDTSQMVMGIRENLKIQFFEQDSDNVRTNRITVRAEARIAFASYGAANAIKGSFA